MPPQQNTTGSGRAGLARLVAVLAVIGGLILLQGSFCETTLPAASCCASAAQTASDTPTGDAAPSEPVRHSGAIEACLLVLVALCLVAARAREPESHFTGLSRPRAGAPPRSPRLALQLEQLCVLRT